MCVHLTDFRVAYKLKKALQNWDPFLESPENFFGP